MPNKINIIGLVAAVSTLLLIAISVFVPWWHLTVGKPAISEVNFSPVNLNFALFGSIITVPLIWALNIASLLSLATGGITMLIYSIRPTKPYAKKLLEFGYKKPLYAVILFVIEIVGLALTVKTLAGFDFPLMGSGALQLPASMAPNGISISVSITSGFEWPFYFAIIVVALCAAARLYHRKTVTPTINLPIPPPPTVSN